MLTFRTKPCKHCGTEFTPSWSGTHYCSVRCQLYAHTTRADCGCLEWTGHLYPTGYGNIRINKMSMRAHRVAWELANGPIPDGIWVLHSCDNRKCVEVAHLFLGTQEDNTRDMISKKRQAKGSSLPQCKLSTDKVNAIKQFLRDGYSEGKIAKLYGVHRMSVADIKRGDNWKWLE